LQLACYAPESFQNYFVRHLLPADYTRLRLNYPADAEDLYFRGERKKSLPAISELLNSGRFRFWLSDQPDSREALFCVLILVRQDPVLWRQVIDELRNFETSEKDLVKVRSSAQLQDLMKDADMDDIAVLIRAGFLPENFVKFRIPEKLWVAAIIAASLFTKQ